MFTNKFKDNRNWNKIKKNSEAIRFDWHGRSRSRINISIDRIIYYNVINALNHMSDKILENLNYTRCSYKIADQFGISMLHFISKLKRQISIYRRLKNAKKNQNTTSSFWSLSICDICVYHSLFVQLYFSVSSYFHISISSSISFLWTSYIAKDIEIRRNSKKNVLIFIAFIILLFKSMLSIGHTYSRFSFWFPNNHMNNHI